MPVTGSACTLHSVAGLTMNSAYRIQDLFTLPGWLSLSRVGLAVCFPLVVSSPWLALSVVAAAAVSDMLDGYVARRLHQNTPMGAALDPVTDKIFASSVMLTLLCADRLSITGAVLMSARELGELPLLLWMLVHPRARPACELPRKADHGTAVRRAARGALRCSQQRLVVRGHGRRG